LKPSSILIEGGGQGLISDFAALRPPNCDTTMTAGCGRVHYTAPETLEENADCTQSAIVLSFGPILLEVESEQHCPAEKAGRAGTRQERNRHENRVE
jgi:serine/threonine protein kinase